MAYSKIVTLRQMRPAYNIKEESSGEWKTFIANDQFNDFLQKAVNAVRNNDADTHKSMWIAGTYGTGKSHAGAVIQHLLCDQVAEIEDYVNDEYGKEKYDKLRNSLLQLRNNKRLFPVNLYGQQSIAHEEDLSLQMQREIKRALIERGIKITVKTDFDTYVQHIEQQPSFWEQLISQNAQLASTAPDLNKLKSALQTCDSEVMERVREALRKGGYDIRLKNNNLQQWIFEVQEALREKTDYCGLLIIWDEFTEILTCSIGTRLLVQLQEIAEAMMNPENDSYFLFISHPSALNSLKEEEREKTKGRYHYKPYNMEPVSAFKIMSKKFKIVNYFLYEKHQNNFFVKNPGLLEVLSQSSNKNEDTKENIKNLFPLHPATANLATYYAREAGSSSRSVFEFLACDAVRDFLDDEHMYEEKRTITADYLWDYVKEYFESDSGRFGAVTERYNSHHLQVESQGENYVKVFKGILLLNALNNIANSDTVTPSTVNIENLFIGTEVESQLPEILEFLNEKSIIQRQPNGNYSILFTALPGDEIQKIKDQLKTSTFLYTDQVVKFGNVAKNIFIRNLTQVARQLSFSFFSLQSNEYTLMNRIGNFVNSEVRSYETPVAIMVARNSQELAQLKDIVEKRSSEDEYRNIAFLVVDTFMGDKNYERFIEYQANAQCAQSHSLPNQTSTYNRQAGELIQEWVGRMRNGNMTFYLGGDSLPIAGSRIASTINSTIAPAIFNQGPESLELIRTKSSTTYWKKAAVKATVDAVLNYNTKADIIAKCGGPARHVEFLLQDSVDENLNWKEGLDSKHPLKLVCDYVDEWLGGRHTNKNQSFNLGEKLIGLTKAPFGLYQSYAPMAIVAFAMRKYVNVIFDTNGKQRSAQHLVDDVVELFKAWEIGKVSNKLNFIFESKEAGQVSKMLVQVFKLNKLPGYSNISSLKDARWAVLHEYAKEKGYPLWSLNYCPDEDMNEDRKEFISNLMKVVSDPESMKNPTLLAATMSGYNRNKIEIGNILLDARDNYRKGFEVFMKGVEKVNLKDSEIESAKDYLKAHLPGEVGLWDEKEVSEKLLYWRIDQQTVPTKDLDDLEPYVPQGGDTTYEPVVEVPKILEEKRLAAKEKLNSCSNLQEAVKKMIENEGSLIIDTLLKYV